MEEKKKRDFSPPGWLVRIHEVKLDEVRAQKLQDMRMHLCQTLGQDNEECSANALWIKALDLLLNGE